MVAELQAWDRHLNELKAVEALMSLTPETQKSIDQIKLVQNKMSKDLIKVFAAIRGYKLEAELAHKQAWKLKKLHDEKNKQGDVSSTDRDTGKVRVFQAKAVSTHSNSDVNRHIKTAFVQIMGVNGEIPAPKAKLSVVIVIHSSKNTWPFLAKHYNGKAVSGYPSQAELVNQIGRKITPLLKQAYVEAQSRAWNPRTSGPAKRSRDGKIISSRYTKFLEAIDQSEIVLKVEYRKPIVLNSDKTITPRLSSGGVKHVTLKLGLTKTGMVKMGQWKITPRNEAA